MFFFNLASSGRLLRQLALVTGLSVTLFALASPEAYAATNKRPISKTAKNTKVKVATKRTVRKSSVSSKRVAIREKAVVSLALPSVGHQTGLQSSADLLNLKSSVALVIDQNTNEVLFSKNDKAVLPIASLTKLMTGLVISGA